jgi:hypothetical protein
MYQAIVAKIKNVTPIPDTDNIATGDIFGNTVVVSRKTSNEHLGIYFGVDGQLSKEFAQANDLIRYKDPSTGEMKGGFFDDNRRVRAQKFRGVRSEGFWCPIEYLKFTGCNLEKLQEGERFDVLNGVPICNKYITEATRLAAAKKASGIKKKLKEKRSVLAFPKHFDTSQFRESAKSFKVGDLITITEKLHGTSQRFAYTEEEYIYPKWSWGSFAQKIGLKNRKAWVHVVGTRNVTLRSVEEKKGYYEDENFRFSVVKNLEGKLHKHEILFFEVVGWVNNVTSIMPKANTESLKDKQFRKKYGQHMYYSYGTEQGQADIYVYRIAHMNEDGFCVDLSWEGVKKRCQELGIKHVPELTNAFIYDGDLEKLRKIVEDLTEGESTVDNRHIREGVCVRADKYPTPMVAKNKSFAFKVLEGIAKDNSDYVDMEESA